MYHQNVSVKGVAYTPPTAELTSGFYTPLYKLITLEGSPREVGGGFYCHYNKLASLKHAPLKVSEVFICHNNPVELNYDKYLKSIKRIDKLKQL